MLSQPIDQPELNIVMLMNSVFHTGHRIHWFDRLRRRLDLRGAKRLLLAVPPRHRVHDDADDGAADLDERRRRESARARLSLESSHTVGRNI